MSNSTIFKTPLSLPVFYVLLALVPGERHGYGIINAATDMSLGGVNLATGTVYTLLKRLTSAGLIESVGYGATVTRDMPRVHYGLTPRGEILVKRELRRMKHAVAVGEANGLFEDKLPLDLQEMLAAVNAQAGAKTT